MSENNLSVFAIVVDNDVVGTIRIPQTAPNFERLNAGLSSDPKIVECSSTPEVGFGWTFDGTSFVKQGE
jgi:hypothetical protein